MVNIEQKVIDEVAKSIWSVWSIKKNVAETWEDIVMYGHSDVELARMEAVAAIEKIAQINGLSYKYLTLQSSLPFDSEFEKSNI